MLLSNDSPRLHFSELGHIFHCERTAATFGLLQSLKLSVIIIFRNIWRMEHLIFNFCRESLKNLNSYPQHFLTF